jgi:hypothetical protein
MKRNPEREKRLAEALRDNLRKRKGREAESLPTESKPNPE